MNTHEKYQTVSHGHLDFSFVDANGQISDPKSGLMLVECADGRFYIEQDFGDEYSQFSGIVKSSEDVTTAPTFYQNEEDAARAAFAFIKQLYPRVSDERLAEYLD